MIWTRKLTPIVIVRPMSIRLEPRIWLVVALRARPFASAASPEPGSACSAAEDVT